jgi:hypothetical protein
MGMRKLPDMPIETLISFLSELNQAATEEWQVTFGDLFTC